MRSAIRSGTAAVLAAAQLCAAQTFTSCNPTTSSSCSSDKALGKTITVDFTQGASDYFTEATGTTLTYDGTNGALFSMKSQGQAPTITSNFYIFFGKVTVVMKAANGTGVVSSFVMESDDLDEIDWEWLGGDTTQVESNYFGKGNTTTYDRAIYHTVSAPQDSYHTYVVDWTKERIIWSIDGTAVRTLNYADALGGANFPQTPMVVKMGNWDGGASNENAGTIEWAGGLTDWSTAPFNMYVKSVTIEDAQAGATSYTFGDETGSYESIEISNSNSASSASASATISAKAASGSASSNATATATAMATATATASVSSSSGSSPATSGSEPSATSNVTPVFQDPAPNNSSSNLTTTVTGSSSTSKSTSTLKSTSSSTSASASSTGLVNSNKASSSHGSMDVAVLVLGLTMGYFFM